MSRETLTHLNTNTLVGFTEKRGRAWHYKADLQGVESNHYEGAIPVGDVQRRLFHWAAQSADLQATLLGPDGVTTLVDSSRRVIIRPDTATVLGVFKDGYEIHQYGDWLLAEVSNILGDTLQIGSAGLLKGGAVAWVQVEASETLSTPEGVDYRPHLLACTSHDGSLATTYQHAVTAVVCDNTLNIALGEGTRGAARIKVKHSRHSGYRLADARAALGVVEQAADQFAADVKTLCETRFTGTQFHALLDIIAPVKDAAGTALTGRALGNATSKRETLLSLINNDARVAPWRGNAFGAFQAVNTFDHHLAKVVGSSRADRIALRAVDGSQRKSDVLTLDAIGKVLAAV